MYFIQIKNGAKEGYFSFASRYTPVPKNQADILDRRQTDRICHALKALGYTVQRELIK